ncbi:MAG: tetratricopeptide repeat-containing glycosyltransferase family 2 protein [Cellulosilyticaceae bacterium]
MITISLCMIVKNEEDVLGNCLESVKDVVDEINIVDTGATDKTREIASQYTDRIFDFKWIDDFAAARNYSFEHATKDYILWLDADDVMLEEDVAKLRELKNTLTKGVDCVTFKYNYASDEKGNPTLVFRRERLVKRGNGFKWIGFIHEYIGGARGKSIDADICVTHRRVHGNPDRNLNIYKKKLAEGIPFSQRDIYYYGKELYYHQMHEEAIEVLESLLEQPIWIEEKIDSICKIADSYNAIGKVEEAKQTLFKAFPIATPRGEILYRLGKIYQDANRYEEAIFWYASIENAKMPEDQMGFTYIEYWTWRPALELCVCYFQVGDVKKSYEANERARVWNPDNPSIVSNTKYFESLDIQK